MLQIDVATFEIVTTYGRYLFSKFLKKQGDLADGVISPITGIHVGPSLKKNQSSASRYEIPKTDPNFFAQTRFTSSKFTSGFRFFHFLRRESDGRESRARTLY